MRVCYKGRLGRTAARGLVLLVRDTWGRYKGHDIEAIHMKAALGPPRGTCSAASCRPSLCSRPGSMGHAQPTHVTITLAVAPLKTGQAQPQLPVLSPYVPSRTSRT